MLLTLFMLGTIYWLLYSTVGERRINPISSSKQQNTPQPFSWNVQNDNKKIKISTSQSLDSSGKNEWIFDLVDDYIFDDHHKAILEKDHHCFGKSDGSKIKATGKKLYDYLQQNNFYFKINNSNNNSNNNNNNSNNDNKINSQNYLLGQNYYFSCYQNKIHDLYTCPSGTLFKNGDCSKINICTGQKNGKTFPDIFPNNDLRYYRVCKNGEPKRKRCQPENFFYYIDSCRSAENDLVDICNEKENNFIFPLSRKKYIRCIKDNNINSIINSGIATSRVENCPEGMSILPSWDKCYPDSCINHPEGFIKAMPPKNNGGFIYSPGYFVCGKDNKINNVVQCSNEWDFTKSNTANLTHLPMVFDENLGKCTIPSFCKNVQPQNKAQVVVPAYEYTKYVKNWSYSTIFDSFVGYRCEDKNDNNANNNANDSNNNSNNNTSKRFIVNPGDKIDQFRIVSACGDIDKKIPIGDEVNKYYDCNQGKIVTCNKSNPIFSMGEQACVKLLKNAHTFKNRPFFRLDGLSPWNNWMEPWDIERINKNQLGNKCLEPESKYLINYNVCSHPDCEKFPFLKQIPSMHILLRDNKNFCKFQNNKIMKKSYETKDKLNFWSQKHYVGEEEEEKDSLKCNFGQKIQSGNFLFDSTLFATCNLNQPFVFCPSSSTKGITRLLGRNIYACVPNDDVYIGEIPPNTAVKFYVNEILGIQPEIGSTYRINKDKNKYYNSVDTAIPIQMNLSNSSSSSSSGIIEYWSNKKSKVLYRNLVNYPINIYIKNQKIKFSGEYDGAYWMKKNKVTKKPISLLNHDIKDKDPFFVAN